MPSNVSKRLALVLSELFHWTTERIGRVAAGPWKPGVKSHALRLVGLCGLISMHSEINIIIIINLFATNQNI